MIVSDEGKPSYGSLLRVVCIVLFLFVVIALSLGIWSHFVEPWWFEVTSTTIEVFDGGGNQSDGEHHSLKVLHLSDLHYSDEKSLQIINKAVSLGLEQSADLTFITGDFVATGFSDEQPLINALKRLSAVMPVFACPGNHDGGNWARMHRGHDTVTVVKRLLEKSGVTFLVNQSVTIEMKGHRLMIVGLGDLWSGSYLPQEVLSSVLHTEAPEQQKATVIVLSHNPDTKKNLLRYEWDLLLCGHSHGGQVAIPFIGAPFAPVQDKTCVKGFHRYEGRPVYVTRGVASVAGVRLNCRPEVTVLTLQ